MKISNRINFNFIMAFVVVFSFVVLVVGVYTTSLVKKNIYAYLTSSNRARAEHIRTFLQDQKKTAVILAAASVYRDFLKEPITSDQYPVIKNKIDKRFVRTIEADPQIREIFILNTQGQLVASSDVAQEGKDKSKDHYFLFAQNDVFVKDIYFSNTTKQINYAISAPIKDDNGNLLGVSVLRYSPDYFFSVVSSENGLGDTEENFLVNKNKFFITPSRFWGDKVILDTKVDTQNVNNCFDPREKEYIEKNGYSGLVKAFGSQIIDALDYRGVNVVATHAYIPETGWCLVTKGDKSDLFSFRPILIIILLLIFLGAGVILSLVGYLISKKITKPINSLEIAAQKISQGDFDYKLAINSKDEIGKLSEAFNSMSLAVKKSRAEVDLKVKDQTKELEESERALQLKLSEINKLNSFMLGRESKMIELKNKIKELEKKIKI